MHILTMCLLLYFSTDSECFAKFLYLVFLHIHDIRHIHVATHGLFPFNLADFTVFGRYQEVQIGTSQ